MGVPLPSRCCILYIFFQQIIGTEETTTIPAIETEPNVSCVPVVSVTFLIGYIQNCLPVYQCVLVKQKFDWGMDFEQCYENKSLFW
jgi:hypothetical protein